MRTLADLAAAGLLTTAAADALVPVAERYAIALTPNMAELIDRADPADPIARQFVPDDRELHRLPEESSDPIGDTLKSPLKGVVHRYPDRVLLKVTGLCPVYCRFCFRREMVGPQNAEELTADDLAAALAYIKANPAIWEVILTGGDPLILSPRRVREVSAALATIPHVQVLRWHSRVPAVAPDRITPELIATLHAFPRAVVVGLHANHPRELTAAARAACRRLISAGIGMVSQTVLLAGVNDDAGTLEALMRGFVETGIKPYYLHHADLAPGTAHFRTRLARGQAIMAELRRRLSGIALPTYVLDIPGAHGKVPVGPGYLEPDGADWIVIDARGERHAYRDVIGEPD